MRSRHARLTSQVRKKAKNAWTTSQRKLSFPHICMYLEPACSGVKIGFPVLGQKIAQSERKLNSVQHQILGGRNQMMQLYLRSSNFEALASNNAQLNFKEVTEFRLSSPFAKRILGKYS